MTSHEKACDLLAKLGHWEALGFAVVMGKQAAAVRDLKTCGYWTAVIFTLQRKQRAKEADAKAGR